MKEDWYKRSRRKFFLDYHIDGWDEEFLSQYDPEVFAQTCYEADATAVTYMANTHSGLLNWPSKIGGTLHPFLKGRDMLKETLDAIHKRGMDAVVYYVCVFVEDYWNKHPESRSTFADGTKIKQAVATRERPHRFATCCFNEPGYRKRTLDEIEELCRNYDFEGIWPDMTFWPTICYCDSCREKYRRETGKEIPSTINFRDPEFMQFVNIRKKWLYEYCKEIDMAIRTYKPGIKYAQQSGLFGWDWMAGASNELADVWDWMSADQYSDRFGLSFTSKMFYDLSRIKPFERLNCWNYPCIHEHAVTRTEDEMSMVAYNSLMNDGALTIIDQINPDGRIHFQNYKMMKKVFDKMIPYEPYLGGEFVQDVGLYYSLNSNMDISWDGMDASFADFSIGPEKFDKVKIAPGDHQAAVNSAAKTCTLFHVPYGIVTKKDLPNLSKYKVLVLCNVYVMDKEERAAIRAYVKNGGKLYASKETSTIDIDGTTNGNFYLEDLFGVEWKGMTDFITTYVSPAPEGKFLFADAYEKYDPISVGDTQTIVEAKKEEGKILATQSLPYELPSEDRYAAILTEPAGQFTDRPALYETSYGKGTVIYSSAMLESGDHISQRETFYRILKYLGGRFSVELKDYAALEITRFEREGKTMLHLLNYQRELPNIPVYNLKFEVVANGKVSAVKILPEGRELDCETEGEIIRVHLPYLKDYALIEVSY